MNKHIRTLAFVLIGLAVGIFAAVSLTPTTAHAQTCNIPGFVASFPVAINTALGGFSTTGGGTYVPVQGGYGSVYSDGTTLIVAQKTGGAGPAMALIRVHFQELDTLTHP